MEDVIKESLARNIGEVIGYNNAIAELSRVEQVIEGNILIKAFGWDGTPQGHEFWRGIHYAMYTKEKRDRYNYIPSWIKEQGDE